MDIKLTRIPLFLEASSKKKLVKKMLKNNLESGLAYEYRDIQQEAGRWIAWYVADLENAVFKGED